jgi:hypothetical protein
MMKTHVSFFIRQVQEVELVPGPSKRIQPILFKVVTLILTLTPSLTLTLNLTFALTLALDLTLTLTLTLVELVGVVASQTCLLERLN